VLAVEGVILLVMMSSQKYSATESPHGSGYLYERLRRVKPYPAIRFVDTASLKDIAPWGIGRGDPPLPAERF